jgi:hypothetical protein
MSAKVSNQVSQPIKQPDYTKPVITINNKATRIFKKIAIGAGAAALLAGACVVFTHTGGTLLSSCAFVGAGGIAAMTGGVTLALKWKRDRNEQKKVGKEWDKIKDIETNQLTQKLERLDNGNKLESQVKIGGKTYTVCIIKGKSAVKIRN